MYVMSIDKFLYCTSIGIEAEIHRPCHWSGKTGHCIDCNGCVFDAIPFFEDIMLMWCQTESAWKEIYYVRPINLSFDLMLTFSSTF